LRGNVEDIRAAVAKFHDDVGGYVNQCGLRPAPGSKADLELSAWPPQDELLPTSFSQAALLLESAADHMASVERLLHNPIQSIAPWTCARGALESSAFGCWLLEPSIDAANRVARSLAFRGEGITERLKVERLVGDDAGVAYSQSRLVYLEQEASRLGFEPIVDARGKRLGIGVRLPSATGCIAGELNMEFEFRVFSSIAHSHPGALSTLGFSASDPSQPTMLEKDLSGPAAALLLARSAQAVHAIVRRRAQLFGHTTDSLDRAVDSVCATLNGPLEAGMRRPLPS
jgi:hypothetical protein